MREHSVGRAGREKLSYRNNYKGRVVGPWVVGVYKNRASVRFFIVEDRKGSTLRDIIRGSVEEGSVVRKDEWRG